MRVNHLLHASRFNNGGDAGLDGNGVQGVVDYLRSIPQYQSVPTRSYWMGCPGYPVRKSECTNNAREEQTL
jgi:hypothetical protein